MHFEKAFVVVSWWRSEGSDKPQATTNTDFQTLGSVLVCPKALESDPNN